MMESVQTSMLLSEPLVRSSMAAFVTGILCISQKYLIPKSLKYYLDGIRDLKFLFQTVTSHEQFSVKLVMMFFLGCREVRQSQY